MVHSVSRKHGFTCWIVAVAAMQMFWTHVCEAASVPSLVLPGTVACDPKNRDPCSTFPGLCSTDGGLCVLKGPCEYECICPPDGRRGRDCTGKDEAPTPKKNEGGDSSKSGNLLNSLLIIPQDLFWDLNHVLRPEETVKMMPSTPTGSSSITTPSPRLSPDSATTTTIRPQITTTTLPQATVTQSPFTHYTTSQQMIVTEQPLSGSETTPQNSHNKHRSGVPLETTTMPRQETTTPTPIVSPTASVVRQDETTPPKEHTTNGQIRNTLPASPQGNKGIPTKIDGNEGKTTASPISKDKSHFAGTTTPRAETNIITSSTFSTPASSTSNNDTTLSSLSINGTVFDDNLPNLTDQNSTSTSTNYSTTPAPSTIVGRTASTNPNAIQSQKDGPAPTTTTSPVSQATAHDAFPGHDNFPTFFQDVFDDTNTNQHPQDAAMSKKVHRVFYPNPEFEKIERGRA